MTHHGKKEQPKRSRFRITKSAPTPIHQLNDEDLEKHRFWQTEQRKMDTLERRRFEQLLTKWGMPTENLTGHETPESQYKLSEYYKNLSFEKLVEETLPKAEINGSSLAVVDQPQRHMLTRE
jgi:hypothetical protein